MVNGSTQLMMTEQEELLLRLQEEIDHGNGDAVVFEPNFTIYDIKHLVDNECTEKER
jgi:hypothetical protein